MAIGRRCVDCGQLVTGSAEDYLIHRQQCEAAMQAAAEGADARDPDEETEDD